jgi:hypothetical protein
MTRQTYYVTREQRHPLYRTRMLTAGQALELDSGAAALYRKLGVDMADEKPKGRARPLAEPAEEPKAAPRQAPKATTRKRASRRKTKK